MEGGGLEVSRRLFAKTLAGSKSQLLQQLSRFGMALCCSLFKPLVCLSWIFRSSLAETIASGEEELSICVILNGSRLKQGKGFAGIRFYTSAFKIEDAEPLLCFCDS